jgi:hypothetical protein
MRNYNESFIDILYNQVGISNLISNYTYKYYTYIFNTPIIKELIKND